MSGQVLSVSDITPGMFFFDNVHKDWVLVVSVNRPKDSMTFMVMRNYGSSQKLYIHENSRLLQNMKGLKSWPVMLRVGQW